MREFKMFSDRPGPFCSSRAGVDSGRGKPLPYSHDDIGEWLEV